MKKMSCKESETDFHVEIREDVTLKNLDDEIKKNKKHQEAIFNKDHQF